MRYLKIIVGVLLIIAGVIFVLQNNDLQRPITLKFDPLAMVQGWSPSAEPAKKATAAKPAETKPAETKPAETKPAEAKPAEAKPAGAKFGIPTFILIFMAFFAGILVAALFGLQEKFRLKKVVRERTSKIRELDEELKRLRNLPLSQPATEPKMVERKAPPETNGLVEPDEPGDLPGLPEPLEGPPLKADEAGSDEPKKDKEE